MTGSITTVTYREPVALYRHFDKSGRLLYVGQSANPMRRIETHAHSGDWIQSVTLITIEWFPNRVSAVEAENTAITSENPVFNAEIRPARAEDDWPTPLGQYLMDAGISSLRFAQRVGKHDSTIRRWCRGEKHPSDRSKRLIEEATSGKVRSNSWGAA